ncbi:hypothetical protein BN1723_013932, partial [Verticillium longisporum]
ITPSLLKPYDPEEIRKSRKRAATKFSKRRKTFLRRAHDLSRDCQAKVYTFIEYNHRTWLRTYPLPEIFIPSMFSTSAQLHDDKHDVEGYVLLEELDDHVVDK